MATRQEVLDVEGLIILQGTYSQSESPTLSTHRARWDTLQHWSDFPQQFETFWRQVGDLELSTVVDGQRYIDSIPILLGANVTAPPTSERQLYPIFDLLYKIPHNLAASGNVSHFHSTIQVGSAEYGPIGDPDYIFVFNGALVGIIEVKTFWKVTKESIDEGYHAGRLAIEQTYGYMVRNGRKYGIMTTINGFAFLCRDNHGKLFMTKLAPSSVPTPTILKMLYFMSYLAAAAEPLPETDGFGQTLSIPAANYKYPNAAPRVPGPSSSSPSNYSQLAGNYGQNIGSTSEYVLAESSGQDVQLVVEPWIRSNCLGTRTFKGRLLPDRDVVAKLWDSHTYKATDRDNEVEAYMKLQSLWGTVIPRFVCAADFDFCFGIVLELIEAIPLSLEHVSEKLSKNISDAFNKIHEVGVIHGDVRKENILVREDESVVIVDFDHTLVNNVSDELIRMEEQDVNALLSSIQN